MAQSKYVGESTVYYITRIKLDNKQEQVLQFTQFSGTFNFNNDLENGTPYENLEQAQGIKQGQELLAKMTGQNVDFKLLKQVQTTTEENEQTSQ